MGESETLNKREEETGVEGRERKRKREKKHENLPQRFGISSVERGRGKEFERILFTSSFLLHCTQEMNFFLFLSSNFLFFLVNFCVLGKEGRKENELE